MHPDYLYDRINRLIGWIVTGMPDTMRYTYDAVGNRLTDSLTWKQGAYRYGQATGVGPNRLMRMVDSNVQTGLVLDSTRYTYDFDGATTRRIRVDLNAGTTVDEKFKYSYRDLLRRYTAGPGGTAIAQDWRYRYNPFGEREQKRMYYMGIDTLGAGYQHPWVYYLLGGSKEQLAVWHGLETCDPMCSDTGQRVYMYPVEYLTFGSGTAKVITQPDGVQQYKLSDHLGTSRAVVVSTGSTISETDYEPFGEPIPVSGSVPRLSYIDKENDFENKLGDYGLRKYDGKIGRFLSIDSKWETYPSFSVYNYAASSPIGSLDPDGKDVIVLSDPNGASGFGHAAVLIGDDKIGWYLFSKNGGTSSGTKGGSEAPDVGKHFKTLKEFAESSFQWTDNRLRYREAYRIKTTHDQDVVAYVAATLSAKSDYILLGQSCIDVVSDALRAAGLDPGLIPDVLPPTMSGIPNTRFKQIKENNKGIDASLSIYPEPRIDVGPKP